MYELVQEDKGYDSEIHDYHTEREFSLKYA